MPYKIKTDCYKNGIFFGSPSLYAPNFDAPYINFSYNDLTWSSIVSTCGDNAFSLFKIPFHSPSLWRSEAPLSVNGVRKNVHTFEHVAVDASNDVYDFYVKANDNHVRIIRMTINNTGAADQDDVYKFNNYIRFTYIIDGVTKLSDVGGNEIKFLNTFNISQNYRRSAEWYCTLPWKGKIAGVDKFLSASGEANYETSGTTIDVTTQHISLTGSTESASNLTKFNEWLSGWVPDDYDPDDPYPDPDDDDDDDTDDPDPDPLPGISAVGTGFATIFTPSLSQLRNLSTRFWNATIIDFFQNLVENIENMFLSLAMVPFTVPAGRTVSVNFLGLFDTGISLTLAAQQFIEFNMGSIDLGNNSKIWKSNSALDYSPFSKLSIYLPFIGSRELDIDDCRGKVISLKYRIDILSGECVALISVAGATIYQFSGNCLTQIPITHENMRGLVSDAIMVATTFATGATSTGAAIAEEGAAVAGAQTAGELASEGWKLGNKITRNASALASTTANAVLGGKPSYTKSGSISGACGFLAVRQPYLYLTTPISAIPNFYRKYSGYPCNRTIKLGQLSGFTVVESIRLNNLVATAPEVSEIYDLLKEGVII